MNLNGALAFFGAFNPPTLAHLELARLALEQTGGDEVIFVPSQTVYIRDQQGKDFAYGEERRLAMLCAAAEKRPWMRVTDWEMKQRRQPRTYETLCHLREKGHPAALLIGSDKLPELEKGWKHVREIAEEFGMVCLARGRDDCEKMIREDPYLLSLAPFIRVVRTPDETRMVSSTAVRRLIAEIRRREEELAAMVPEEIRDMLRDE